SMHGEVTLKGDKFHIALLDKDKRPVKLADQSLTANGGPTGKAAKLAVEKEGDHFIMPAVKSGEWVIVQFKENAKPKAVTARFEYNTSPCPECKKAEWLCACEATEKK